MIGKLTHLDLAFPACEAGSAPARDVDHAL